MKLPRFTLRDLFWLMTTACVVVAWWVDRSRSMQYAEELYGDALEWRSHAELLNSELSARDWEVVLDEARFIHVKKFP